MLRTWEQKAAFSPILLGEMGRISAHHSNNQLLNSVKVFEKSFNYLDACLEEYSVYNWQTIPFTWVFNNLSSWND